MHTFIVTVLEVAIGDYGVTVDKLAAAVETLSKDDNKAVTYAMKSQLEGSCIRKFHTHLYLFIFSYFPLIITVHIYEVSYTITVHMYES